MNTALVKLLESDLSRAVTTSNAATFSISFRKRYNDKATSDDVIKFTAEHVNRLQPQLTVDLTNADIVIIIEVFSNFSCLSIVTRFNQYAKFNLKLVK